MRNMREQSRQRRKDIERIWGLDENKSVDPRKLEGILAEYSDSKSSAERVREVRDDI